MTYSNLVEFSINLIQNLTDFASSFIEWVQSDIPIEIASLLGFEITWLELFFGSSLVIVIVFGLIKFFVNIL